MSSITRITPDQHPAAGKSLVRHTGDTINITLSLAAPVTGQAWLRTNIGFAPLRYQETVAAFNDRRPRQDRGWRDLPMRQVAPQQYAITLPLCQVGGFDFKAYFLPDGEKNPWWPEGENTHLKVLSGLYAANNAIYNAFVRQFGPAMGQDHHQSFALDAAAHNLDQAGYTVIPPSGTFRSFAKHLDFIQKQMGFRIIQLLPVHPTPTTYGRMGRYGSPFAPLDFYSVDPALADFDRNATPMEQFLQLLDQIHGRGGVAFLDLPIDHTGWASTLQCRHPEWFRRDPDGAYTSPGAWGVVWADLCKLDFNCTPLWQELAEVFLFWCRNGVDGFRCDAGYMIPADAWEYIIARVRLEFPDTIFFLEGLGGSVDDSARLLRQSGMDWAYSELFQNYSHQEISGYLDFALNFSKENGPLVNFAETHDNNRLAANGAPWARLRVALCALTAPAGCFGIANGVEWLATQRIDVHGAASLSWGNEENLVALLSQLNRLAATNPAFHANASIRRPLGSEGEAIGVLRVPRTPNAPALLVVVNPLLNHSATFQWHFLEFDPGAAPRDMLTGREVPVRSGECNFSIKLRPGEVLCLEAAGKAAANGYQQPQLPSQREMQMLRQTVLEFIVSRNGGIMDIEDLDVQQLALELYQSPWETLCHLYGTGHYPQVIQWHTHRDESRQVLLPPGHHLLVESAESFIADLIQDGRCLQRVYSMTTADGKHFGLFRALSQKVESATPLLLQLRSLSPDGTSRLCQGQLLQLPAAEAIGVDYSIGVPSDDGTVCAIATTDLGGYSLQRAAWGTLESQYDAMLAANQHPTMPVDRTVVLNRCRIWVVNHGLSRQLDRSCQRGFMVTADNAMRWDFQVADGTGHYDHITLTSQLERHSGVLKLQVHRNADAHSAPSGPISVILRPDIDDRCFHGNTMAYQGAEEAFPQRVTPGIHGFDFALSSGNRLAMRASQNCGGTFNADPQWEYKVHHRLEAQRGLHADGDLFSPGYFTFQLADGATAAITAQVTTDQKTPRLPEATPIAAEPLRLSFQDALDHATDAFVVRRDQFRSIIAGYPWFLDWGRDTLICVRGLIAAGRLEDAMEIIRIFASFEDQGTLPNMISGEELSNRDTTDAPLLLFLAVKDYLEQVDAAKAAEVLATPCGQRSLLEVLQSIVKWYIQGTPNGIQVDEESGLVYSPSHFTWMDTNYPAATPRQGYPIEIQSYWYCALQLLAKYVPQDKSYATLAQQVRQSVLRYYPSKATTGFADCLHCHRGTPAAQALADDHARPNQLFAITLGLVDDPQQCRHIVNACSQLLIPGAMRSLAAQPVEFPLPVQGDGGIALNDPHRPYWGEYCGDENTRRKPAYHNGTAWQLQMPLYCEALYRTYGDENARNAALAILGSSATLLNSGCLGHIPEVADGDFPHHQRGCFAQAWSLTECRRVLQLLQK